MPAGIATGQRLRLTGEGEAGGPGGPAGDLYVVIHVQEHPFFHRDGNDLYCEIPLNFPTVALGGEIRIPTLEGEESFKVPESTESEQGSSVITDAERGALSNAISPTYVPGPWTASTTSWPAPSLK